jgi:uroporphyrin-3 C-methyltransferase
MSGKAEPRPTVVIDMAAEPDLPGSGRPGRAPLVLALLALLLAALGLAGGYYWWQQMREELAHMSARTQAAAQLQQELHTSLQQARKLLASQQQKIAALDPGKLLDEGLSESRKSLEQQRSLMSAERTRMEQREVELRAIIADLRKRLGKPDKRWMVAEAEYLIGIARRRLELVHDVKTAMAALAEADRRLADTGDPRWDVLRNDITRQMAALKETRSNDRGALLARLDELKPGLAGLEIRVLAGEAALVPAASDEAPAPADERSLPNLGRDLLQGLKESVRLRHHDQAVQSLVLSGQEDLLRQNLYLILETARLAVVQEDAGLYRDSLARLEQSSRRYFRTESGLAQTLLRQMEQLRSASMTPPIPDLTPLLEALRTRQKLRAASMETQ